MIAEVHDAAPDPVPELALAPAEHLVNRLVRLRRGLHSVQSLPGVCELVVRALSQQVVLGEVPQLEHVVAHFSPQHHGLHDVRVLALVVVGQARAAHAHGDPERKTGLGVFGIEVLFEVSDHPVHRIAVESEVRVVVRYGVQHAENLLGAEIGVGVATAQVLASLLLRLDLALHLDPGLALVHDLRGGLVHQPVFQHRQTLLLREQLVRGAHGLDELEV